MSKDETFYYPDGSYKKEKPKEGQIYEVKSHKKGKFVKWEYDEDTKIWSMVPKGRTPPEVIAKAKEIMKIGEFAKLRPPKNTGTRYYGRYSEYDDYEDEWAYALSHQGAKPYSEIVSSASSRIVGPQRSNIIPLTSNNIPLTTAKDGSYHVPCECGAMHTARGDHSRWCPRHHLNIHRY